MKKALYITITGLILVFLMGHFVAYKYIGYIHKSEFKKHLKTNVHKVEEIEINPSQLFADSKTMRWKDGNTEVEIDGEMYDIVSIRNAGTKVILNVVMDKVEKEQFEKYKKQAGSIYHNSNSGKQNALKDLLNLKVTLNSTSTEVLILNQSGLLFSQPNSCVRSGYKSVLTQPPIV